MRMTRTGTLIALGACAAVVAGPLTVPAAADVADLRYDQWGLETVGASQVWETTRGAGVTVALLDTGVDTEHPDLGSVTAGPDLTGQDLAPGSEHYGVHGTMMAGIVSASGHGVEHSGGVMGVAPDADLLSVRVALDEDDPERGDFPGGAGSGSALAEGIRYAVDQGAQVVSVSLADANAGSEGREDEQRAIDNALANGVVVVVSGGDGGVDGGPAYPAAYEGVLAVGSVGEDGLVSDFSSRQDHIALTAPGEEIIAPAPNSEYLAATGSSAAAAFTSGVAALIRSRYPQLNPEQVTEALLSGSVLPEGAEGQPGYGAGVLNAPRAMAAADVIAADVPAFDPEIAEELADRPLVPTWALWAGGAVLAVVLAVAGGLLLRRRLSNPYDLPPREAPPEGRTRRRRQRGGRRRRITR
ncbi:S8 family serine peptidase [Actinorugispora endophytica]|uniref:Subtilase family protein n=1 Tax=Actinorugispora endophytica TaxID=1605990 RepID=A0A4R6V445_9ACTN|nr:S8 family serine peptidase [Actinorugispora endophytica]TDQ55165.1 subtilase family protein [Actinorugispora endophytica]